MRQPVVAWAGLGLSLLLVAAAATLGLAADGDPVSVALYALIGLPFAAVGALVAARLPALAIGWLMLGAGLSLIAANATDGVARYAALETSAPAIAGWAVLAGGLLFSAFFLLIISTLFLLPNGSLPSQRWRIVRLLIGVLLVCDLLGVFRPGIFGDWIDEEVRNPLGIGALEDAVDLASLLAVLLTFALLLASIASVAIRFRHSQGVERAQLRWVALAVVATGACWIGLFVVNTALPGAGDVAWGVAFSSVGIIPIGIGLAVLRHRLYEIDRVISKAVLYASLTLVLGGVYIGLVLVGQAVFSSLAGSSNLAIAISTLLVAALFLPVRARLQRVVDRRFNRRRYDAQRTLEGFGARLREQVDLDTLERELRSVVIETMQPTHASVWLRTGVRG